MALMAEQVLSHVSRPAVFAGLSMGGYLLGDPAPDPPDIVTGAIFMDTKASADTAAAHARTTPARRRRVLAADHPAIWPTPCCPTCWAPPLSPNAPRSCRQFVGGSNRRPGSRRLRAAATDRPDSAPTLRNYEGPAAVLWGDEDVISPTADQKAMLEMMPQAVPGRSPSWASECGGGPRRGQRRSARGAHRLGVIRSVPRLGTVPALVVTDNLTITKGTTTVLQSVALGLADGDRIRCGGTQQGWQVHPLLRALAGQESQDSSRVTCR